MSGIFPEKAKVYNQVANPRRLHTLSIIQALLQMSNSATRNLELQEQLSNFSSLSRGKNKSRPFIKSVALSSPKYNKYIKPHSGKQEAARNLASGKVDLDYRTLMAMKEERREPNIKLYSLHTSAKDSPFT